MFQWAHDLTKRARGDLGVQRGGLELLVSEQHLDHTDVDPLLK